MPTKGQSGAWPLDWNGKRPTKPPEGRVPFLDHHVAEYVAGLPIRHKIRGTREKYVLREPARAIIAPEVYNRQKHPFIAPPPRSGNDALRAQRKYQHGSLSAAIRGLAATTFHNSSYRLIMN